MKASTPDADELTVVFVDLVRFTSLTEIHGDMAGADAASALVDVVDGVLGDGARLVKTLGDGVLLTTTGPTVAVEIAVAIVEGLHDLDNGIDARVGVHHGPVVERDGDVFGSTVNLAARVSSLAAPGRIVGTRPVAEAVAALDLTAVPLGELSVRGFLDPVELFEIDPCGHDEDWTTDPVCGMRLPTNNVRDRRTTRFHEIGFCSVRCAEVYDDAPGRFE